MPGPALVENPEARKRWQQARGKGGLRRADWDTVLEIISASMVHTIKKHGPDRIAGFSPIPAMSMISYASGARLMQLIGGISLSFYDWYCDLPTASPETWGEQTDVQESADWYHAKMLVSMGANIGMTRTPDCHFLAEGRHNGTKLWVFSPDFSQVAKYADEWVAVNTGQDGAWWMAVNHVLLTEFHHQKKTPYFHRLHEEVHRRAVLGRVKKRQTRSASSRTVGACRTTRKIRRRRKGRMEIPDVGRRGKVPRCRWAAADFVGELRRASGICCSKTAKTAARSSRNLASSMTTTRSSKSSWTISPLVTSALAAFQSRH